MAAIGAAWALGIGWSVIGAALTDFVSDVATAPGRFNLIDYRGATLIAIPQSGHMVMFDQPARFQAALRTFLKGGN